MPTEQVKNGYFTTDLSNWTTTIRWTDYTTVYPYWTSPGYCALQGKNGGLIEQSIDLTNATNIYVKYECPNHHGYGFFELYIDWVLVNRTLDVSKTWIELNIPISGYTGNHSVILTGNNINYEWYVDTVSILTPIDPVASFTTNAPKNQGEIVTFTNTSTGGLTYLWNFGDSSTSTSTNPTHVYTAPGTYTVTLTAYGESGTSSTTTSQITINIAPITANFTCNPTTGSTYTYLTFTNTSSGYNYPTGYTYKWEVKKNARYPGYPSYNWTQMSTAQNYAINVAEGIYDVKLTVTNQWTSSTVTKLAIATINEALPNATFTPNKTYGSFPLTVQFISAQQVNSHLWTIDGTTTTLLNPTYTFTTKGLYLITHKVTNHEGEDTKTTYITVNNPLPIVNFSYTQPCVKDEPITFTNLSQYGITYLWDFGDGNTSTLENPTHTYTTYNTFTVTLTVTNETGSAHTTKSIVTVGNVYYTLIKLA